MHIAAQFMLLFLLALIAGELTAVASNTASLYSLVHLASIDADLTSIADRMK